MTTNGTLQWDDHKMESHKFTETISTVRFRFLDSNQSHYYGLAHFKESEEETLFHESFR